jgi:hypothetical protein
VFVVDPVMFERVSKFWEYAPVSGMGAATAACPPSAVQRNATTTDVKQSREPLTTPLLESTCLPQTGPDRTRPRRS